MAELIRGAFAEVLERNREYFNLGFARARRQNRQLDAEVFSEHLRTAVAPIVAATSQTEPERVNGIAIALYDLSLQLFAKNLLGPLCRYPGMAQLWLELFPRIPIWIAQQPGQVVSACCNAVYNLSVEAGQNGKIVDRWLKRMQAIAPDCADVDQFFAGGPSTGLALRSGPLSRNSDRHLARLASPSDGGDVGVTVRVAWL